MGVRPGDTAGWRERERYFATPPDPDDAERRLIRPEIELSWRRCRAIGLGADEQTLPYSGEPASDTRLQRAAAPIIDRLAEQLQHAPVTILLADRSAQIVDRRAGARELMIRLDRASVAPGFLFAEDRAGTNGIGTALEERRPFQVRGGEHLRESLQNLACIGAPIVHPVHRTVEGVLDITCNVADASDLIAPLITNVVRDIEARLLDESTRSEQALLREYSRSNRRGSAAVVAMSHGITIANPAASRLMDSSDQVLLWEWALRNLDGRSDYAGELRMAEGTDLRVHARRVGERRADFGVVVELRTADPPTHRPTATTFAPTSAVRGHAAPKPEERLVGRSVATARLQRELGELAKTPRPVLVTGEAGVGKRYVAHYLHRRWALADGDALVVDAAEGLGPVDPLRRHMVHGGAVVLAHLDSMTLDESARLQTLIDDAAAASAPLIATARSGEPKDASRVLFSHFAHRVTVDPLRHRLDELDDIARVLLRQHLSDRPAPRLQAATLQTLMGHDWPGNVRELESVLTSALVRSMGFDIAVEHLPPDYQAAASGKQLTALERMEREAVLRALDEAGGNKSVAADRLGIARSTLYRKLRALGLESGRFAG